MIQKLILKDFYPLITDTILKLNMEVFKITCFSDMQSAKYLFAFHENSMLHYCIAAYLNRLTGAQKDEHVSLPSSEMCNTFIPQNI